MRADPSSAARASRCARAMRDLVLARLPELGDGLLLALGDEDRVVPEPRRAPLVVCEPSLEPPLDDELPPVGKHGRESAHVRRAAVVDAVHAREQRAPAGGVVRAREARRANAGLAAQGDDRDTGVLAEGDRVRRRDHSRGPGLEQRVRGERRSGLIHVDAL